MNFYTNQPGEEDGYCSNKKGNNKYRFGGDEFIHFNNSRSLK